MTNRTDTLVVGGGQAGLAAARALHAAGVACLVHERHARIGDSWRERFDSLVLFSPREISALPGLPQDGDPRGYAGKAEMGDYLERFAADFHIPVVTGDGIAHLSRDSDGFTALTDAGRRIAARSVVVATGAFQRPRVPGFARMLSERVPQLDALSYRNPDSVPGRDAIVVGDGATGRQIALELAHAGRRVTLATGSHRFYFPQRLLGRDASWWAWRVGLLTADKSSPAGRGMRALDATPGLHLRRATLRRAGISLVPRCVDAGSDRLRFVDGTRLRCDAVIWSIGYRDETAWLDVEGATGPSGFIEDRGVTPVPGLFHVGREWQRSRASGLICGIHIDARAVTGLVKTYLACQGRTWQSRRKSSTPGA